MIPTFTIDEVRRQGYHAVHIRTIDKADSVQVAHRDECYLFIFQQKGSFQLMLDFRKVTIKGPAIYFILPGQIHQYINAATDTWVLAVDPANVQPYYKTVLDQHFLVHDPFQKYKEMKKPSDYADALKISTPYLNQAVKAFSGFTISYWIQKMVMTEAKRLLYYTDLSVKEISYELGYPPAGFTLPSS